MTEPVLEKVTTFITRGSGAERQLLLFRHEYAGIQIPAGTVEIGEDVALAAQREAQEESGLNALSAPRLLAVQEQPAQDGQCFIYRTTQLHMRPDSASPSWARIRNGNVVRALRHHDDFVQITFAEHDLDADPPYITYQVTAWAPARALAWQRRRYFYLLDCLQETPETWIIDVDGPRFTLFWAPLDRLPPIIFSQAPWVDVLTAHLAAEEP